MFGGGEGEWGRREWGWGVWGAGWVEVFSRSRCDVIPPSGDQLQVTITTSFAISAMHVIAHIDTCDTLSHSAFIQSGVNLSMRMFSTGS